MTARLGFIAFLSSFIEKHITFYWLGKRGLFCFKNASLCILLKPKLRNSLFLSRSKVGNTLALTFCCYSKCPVGGLDRDWELPS